jgi:phage terminase large subunit-like protein
MATFHNVNAANKYARDIVSGKIVACKWVKLACQRHLNDLKKQGKEYPYYFHKETAEVVCMYIQALPHTKGKWAGARQDITLEPWQKFIFAVLFGWKRKKDDKRRFREFYGEIPRKNGKSVLAAGTGNFMFTMDGEFGAEIYCGAVTEKQALEVFKPAKIMIQKTLDLIEAFGIEINAMNMNIPDDGSKFEPVVGNPGDGSSPSCALVDEFHEHRTPDLYETMVTGMGSREQGLVFIITTSGTNLAGPCYDKHLEVKKILEATLQGDECNEELFGIIFTIDNEDDWDKPESLYMANPNIGISVGEDYLLSQLKNAIANPSRQVIYKTKHLNIWCGAKAQWLNMVKWRACGDKLLDIEDFHNDDCYLLIDLASKIDMCATVRLFRREIDKKVHYYAFPKFYLPENTIQNTKEKANQNAYQRWVASGHLCEMPGTEIDFNMIYEEGTEDLEGLNGKEVVYDPWRAAQMAKQFENDGAITVEFNNTVKNMSPAMKELEAAVMSGRFHHNDHPILNWMASNTTNKIDKKENYFPNKESAENKIDGIVAIIMGIGRAMYEPENDDLDLDFVNW